MRYAYSLLRTCMTHGSQLRTTRRSLSTVTASGPTTPSEHFIFHPDFFSEREQKILLSASLEKLDAVESRDFRRRRKEYRSKHSAQGDLVALRLEDIFLPDEYYCFEEGHYDGVIRNYREMHVSSWPEGYPELPGILARLDPLHPDEPTQSHIIHLASDGEILPHVDNTEASGSWILGRLSTKGLHKIRIQAFYP
ncbi:unnamed protein product [Somion occarium]|uniref:Alpha-ketoglutarate-dependent dioxygenase AlkB-like domain-containing protein n=1 Tax=Somion occarium TaxID=3059160 RepID=A0ABP1DEC2_9APHY